MPVAGAHRGAKALKGQGEKTLTECCMRGIVWHLRTRALCLREGDVVRHRRFTGLLAGLALAVPAGIVILPASPADAACTNNKPTCSSARAYGRNYCNSGLAPASKEACLQMTEATFQQCMKDGTWVTRFCNRKGLAKK